MKRTMCRFVSSSVL